MIESFSWHEAGQVLSLRAGFNSALVVSGTAILGLAAGLVGAWALLRKRTLMSDALAHATLPGVCLAFLAMALLPLSRSMGLLLLGAAAAAGLGALVVQWIVRYTRLYEDAAIGIVLSVFFGMGVVLLSLIQSLDLGGEGGLHNFIYGQAAALSRRDLELSAGLAVLVLAAALLLHKELRLLCFDPDLARVQGWPVVKLDLLLMGLVTAVTVSGLQSVGLILVIAFLIIPPAAARFWTDDLKKLLALSAAFGAFSGYVGSALSALQPRAPAGALIVLTAGFLFLLSFGLAPRRGLAAITLMQVKLKVVAAVNLILRRFYIAWEREQRLQPDLKALPLGSFVPRCTLWWQMLVEAMVQGRLLERAGDTYTLSERGRQQAARLLRNYRLWQRYWERCGALPQAHLDFAANLVEEHLAPALVAELEQELRSVGALPTASAPGEA